MSDECLMKQEMAIPFYVVYQAVMRKFTLAGKAAHYAGEPVAADGVSVPDVWCGVLPTRRTGGSDGQGKERQDYDLLREAEQIGIIRKETATDSGLQYVVLCDNELPF